MKQVKKILAGLLTLSLICGLTACSAFSPGQSHESGSDSSPKQSESTGRAGQDDSIHLLACNDQSPVLVTRPKGMEEESLTQAAFSGLLRFASKRGEKGNYLEAKGNDEEAYQSVIEQAIQKGAKLIIAPDPAFSHAVAKMQKQHVDVDFLTVGFLPVPEEGSSDSWASEEAEKNIAQNTLALLFNEEQGGFLAAYAAVKDGYRQLAFIGSQPSPAVINFAYGFAAGAEQAAEEEETQVKIKYAYVDPLKGDKHVQDLASSWYQEGTELIFACEKELGSSVFKAAEEKGGKMIGVDEEQEGPGSPVVSSVVKDIGGSIYDALLSIDKNGFVGGKERRVGVEARGIQLSKNFYNFQKFTEDDYDAIYEQLLTDQGGLRSSLPSFQADQDRPAGGDPSFLAGQYSHLTIDFVSR